jgi:DHA1 family tetracycline resistance protein-like MFS transporter
VLDRPDIPPAPLACSRMTTVSSDSDTTNQPSRPPSRGSLLVIFLTVFIDLLGFGMVLPLLPIYAESFGVSESGWEIGFLMSSFSAMTFIFAPLWGRVSDRIGRRPVLIVGLIGSVGFYLLFGIATIYQSMTLLFIARIGAGIAGATIPAAQAYIADITSLQNRARGMALIGAAFGLGFTFGPLLGAAALIFSGSVETSPWPGFAAAILSAIACFLAIFLLPESLRPGSHHAGHAIIDLRAWHDAFATPSVPALLATAFASVVSFGAFETTLSLLLKDEKHLPFHFSFSQVLLFYAFIGLTLSIAQGFLVRRLAPIVGEARLTLAGGITTMLGFALLVWATHAGSLPLLMVASAIEVTGFALMTPSLQSLISRRSDPRKQGGILGVSQSTSALARVVGPLIAIPLLKLSPAAALPYWAALIIMAIATAIFLLFARRGTDHAGTPTELPMPAEALE